MSDTVLVAIITGFCAVIGQWLISHQQATKRKIDDAVRDAKIDDRLQGIEKRLDEHNNYASKFSEIQTDIAVIKNDIKKGTQHVNIKQENSDSWTTVTKSNNNTVSSTYQFCILGAYRNGGYEDFAPDGTRLYYCKIYSDNTYGGLVFDGVPCYYNGQYGLWDKVSGTFKANSGSGTFSGPSNS